MLAAGMDGNEAFLELLRRHTSLSRPAICRELDTYEASALIPLWEAVEELAGGPAEPPFWAWSWPGSQALARFVLDHPETVRQKVVLDLGCGNGLAALASARAGAARSIANDIEVQAIRMAAVHAERNGLALELEGVDLLAAPPSVPPVEVVLAGDMFYARALAARAEAWLRAAAERGAEVFIGDPGRAYLPRAGLRLLAAYEIPVSRELESVCWRTTRVFHLG